MEDVAPVQQVRWAKWCQTFISCLSYRIFVRPRGRSERFDNEAGVKVTSGPLLFFSSRVIAITTNQRNINDNNDNVVAFPRFASYLRGCNSKY